MNIFRFFYAESSFTVLLLPFSEKGFAPAACSASFTRIFLFILVDTRWPVRCPYSTVLVQFDLDLLLSHDQKNIAECSAVVNLWGG